MASEGRILLIGGSGMLGRALIARLAAEPVDLDVPERSSLDLEVPRSIEETIQRLSPGVILNAAAYTDVGGAERPEERARVEALNIHGPAQLAAVARAVGARFVHVSTDYVFDGRADRPYVEDDPVDPLQEYGRTKLQGERAVRLMDPEALIVRTSTLYGPGPRVRPHYVDAIRRQAAGDQPISVVRLPVSSPTLTIDLADAIVRLVQAGAGGIVHYADDGACSRLELARATVELSGADPARVVEREAPAGDLARPAYSELSTERFQRLTGHPVPHWRESLSRYIAAATAGVEAS